jgi:hypothetical protein
VTHGCKVGSAIVAFGGGFISHFFPPFFSWFAEHGLQEEMGSLESSGSFFLSILVPFYVLFVYLHPWNFSSVDSVGRILAAEVVNRGSGYTSTPSIAVADASCLCGMQVRNHIFNIFFRPLN